MSWKDELYRKLTEKDEWGDNNELKHKLFGDNEWSSLNMSEAVEELKEEIERESWGGGA